MSDERGIIEKVFPNVAANQAAHYGRERLFVIRRLYVPSPLAGCDVENYLTDWRFKYLFHPKLHRNVVGRTKNSPHSSKVSITLLVMSKDAAKKKVYFHVKLQFSPVAMLVMML